MRTILPRVLFSARVSVEQMHLPCRSTCQQSVHNCAICFEFVNVATPLGKKLWTDCWERQHGHANNCDAPNGNANMAVINCSSTMAQSCCPSRVNFAQQRPSWNGLSCKVTRATMLPPHVPRHKPAVDFSVDRVPTHDSVVPADLSSWMDDRNAELFAPSRLGTSTQGVTSMILEWAKPLHHLTSVRTS